MDTTFVSFDLHLRVQVKKRIGSLNVPVRRRTGHDGRKPATLTQAGRG
jgi:hypothetical protein